MLIAQAMQLFIVLQFIIIMFQAILWKQGQITNKHLNEFKNEGEKDKWLK